jgi:hypothetical protein
MPHELSHHADYINRHGMLRWMLRECVRANPLYVNSAALLAYSVLQLNTEIDPQIGKLRGIVISLVLLHVYEFALLGAATTVLTRRTGGGGDLHGLMLVAGLFVGGSFLALDELAAISATYGLVLVPLGLLLAAGKAEWYSRLPGIYLPWYAKLTVLGILAGHSASTLLGSPDVELAIGTEAAQRLAWLCGWASLLPVLPLIWHESRLARERNLRGEGETAATDPLTTPRCIAGAVLMALGTGLAHLFASDWVFDRAPQRLVLWPALAVLSSAWLLLRWHRIPRFTFWNSVLLLTPALGMQTIWQWDLTNESAGWLAYWLCPAFQFWAACVVIYLALARFTGRKICLAGLAGPAWPPLSTWLMRSRSTIPHFRAFVSAALGFGALIGGVVVSLYRERILRWLDPAQVKTEAPPVGESLP